ncbi:MAG: hypothetical protein HOH58_14445 [Opitutaceae bacterium]|jgi:lipopolysaccharide export system protein LptA|nr:hypothetical protein [Opitutaceae bacterium]
MIRHLVFITATLLAPATIAQIVNPLAVPEVNTVLKADYLDMRSTTTESIVICVGNVVLEGTNMKIACDRLEIVAARLGDREATIGEFKGFKSLIATGNVKLVQGDREATCGRAEVLPLEEKVVLTIDPVVTDHSAGFTQAGSSITLLRGERRLHVVDAVITGPPISDLGPGVEDALDESTPTP